MNIYVDLGDFGSQDLDIDINDIEDIGLDDVISIIDKVDFTNDFNDKHAIKFICNIIKRLSLEDKNYIKDFIDEELTPCEVWHEKLKNLNKE